MDDKSISYTQPNQDVLESEKNESWYIQNIRYFSTYYNRPFSRFYDTTDSVKAFSQVEDILVNNAYYLARQRNLSYNYLSGGLGNVQANWRNGQKIAALVNSMTGTMTKVLENIKPSTKSISKRVRNEKIQLIEDLSMKVDASEILDELKTLGVDFQPVNPNIQIADKEEAERYANYTYKDYADMIGVDICDRLVRENFLRQKFGQEFKNVVIGGITGMHNSVVNGKVNQEILLSQEIIWDNSVEDDFNRKSTFRGFIKNYTPSEIRKKWGKKLSAKYGDKVFTEIDQLSQDANTKIDWIDTYNNASNFNWYEASNGKKVGKVKAVVMYWYAIRDTRYKEKDIKYKEQKISTTTKKIDDSKDKNRLIPGDYGVLDICRGTLIGNKWLVEDGYVNNLVRDPNNKSNPQFPIFFYIPNMTLDQYRSIVGRLRELQDEADACSLKVRQLMGRDLGKNYIIYGDKLGLTSPKELFLDFKSINLHVTTGASGEDPSSDQSNSQRHVEPVDLTLDPNVSRYVELKRQLETEMEEISSIPKMSLGTQSTVIGKGVQQTTIQQASLGNTSLYNGMIQHYEEILQNAVNMQRIAFCAEGNEALAEMWVGERGLQFIKASKNFLLEDMGVYLDINDNVDDGVRQRLIAYAQAWSQNPEFGIKPLDIIKLEKAQTFSEMIQILEYSLKKAEMNQSQMAAYKQQIDAIAAEKEQQLQGVIGQQQEQIKQLGNQNLLMRDQANNASKEGMNKEDNDTAILIKQMELGQNKEQNSFFPTT